ncbi:uncharacterized protein IL334_002045 [Kwoniella shivajii]|uniref:CSC1/OSCA1-like 7TM region domain-containing protein n=1 Tax=Kwoniella shivajii TaxID=564305 RepID=A0ABZ1CTT4_9TREE|nr:hypothetical protein IL334_002045 [Kwoniella shivajii]
MTTTATPIHLAASTTPTIHNSTTTLPPSHLGKRHFYLCGDETLSWESEWYTAPFFTSNRISYDSAASLGPVNPPTGIYQNVPECSAILQSHSSDTTRFTSGTITDVGIWSTFTSQGRTYTTSIPKSTNIPTAPSTTDLASSIQKSPTSIASTAPTAPVDAIKDPSSINACAGEWDWQDWGVIAAIGSGFIVGLVLWTTWIILRNKIPGIYATRTWAVPPESRPSKWTIVTFLLPFLHISPDSSTEDTSSLRILSAGLKLAALLSFLALAGILPMILAEVPCLSKTSPVNTFGGRLGTLTDLSLLRLLNALDPSPDSEATSNTIKIMFAPMNERSLTSTIAPAISSAKIRLIIILVILAVLACAGGLYTITRTYALLSTSRKKFEKEVCDHMEMIYIPHEKAKGWKGMSEDGVRRWLSDWCKRNALEEISVIGIFAIPDIIKLKEKVIERERVLIDLEVAETKYMASFNVRHSDPIEKSLGSIGWGEPGSKSTKQSSPSRTTPPDDFLAPKDFYKISPPPSPRSTERFNVPLPWQLQEQPVNSKFKEINRDSAMYGGRFDIGQRIKMDPEGNWVPDPSPQSESTAPLGTTPGSSQEGPLNAEAARIDPMGVTPFSSTCPGPPISPTTSRSPRTEIPRRASAGYTSPLAGNYTAIRESRARFKELNVEIDEMQKSKFAEVGSSGKVKGWIIVGKGVKWLPSAEIIEGYTKEDILWDNTGMKRGNDELWFWVKICAVGVGLGMMMVPVLGLTVATTPGFSHYIGLLKPLARSDGFGSGVVEGLVPAVALSFTIYLSIFLTDRFSMSVKCISRSRQKALAYKAVFYLLLSVTVIWILLLASLEFAVQGFATKVQEGRVVGDGAVFSTWFVFVLLLNLAFVLPALYLLQGKRLFRYLRGRKRAFTPRQQYRLISPPSHSPSMAMTPCLLCVFYASTLLFIFPLLALPILVLLYLSFIANRYMIEHVFVDSSSCHPGTVLALWSIRRFGWTLSLQPLLYGLIVISRNEWAIGCVSIGVAVITLVLSELLTVLRFPPPKRKYLSGTTRKALDELTRSMGHQFTSKERDSRQSDLSLLNRVTALLPGYSRLPSNCPIPLPTNIIDDLSSSEKASYTNPRFINSDIQIPNRFFYESDVRGLIYPPEMIVPVPVIWLPSDRGGNIAQAEANELARYHGLVAVVDPDPDVITRNAKGKGKVREHARGEAGAPLLDK